MDMPSACSCINVDVADRVVISARALSVHSVGRGLDVDILEIVFNHRYEMGLRYRVIDFIVSITFTSLEYIICVHCVTYYNAGAYRTILYRTTPHRKVRHASAYRRQFSL